VTPGQKSDRRLCPPGIDGRIQVSTVSIGAHTGTHIDAPIHFIEGGDSIEKLPLELLMGGCVVVEVSDTDGLILLDELLNCDIPEGTIRILFRTRNAAIWLREEKSFTRQFVALSEEAADYLVQKGVKVVGIDYLSIAPFTDPYPVHQKLLGAGVIVIEGLYLNEVPAGNYQLIALPVKLGKSDGAPARVVLVKGA